MWRIILIILFYIYSCLAQANEIDKLTKLIMSQKYCLFKEMKQRDFSLQILLKSEECDNDNNSENIIVLKFINKNKVETIFSDKLLPSIPDSIGYAFDGLRDIRLGNYYLEVELAYPNRVLSEAYSMIFLFKKSNDNLVFYDYKINDLCYVPEEKLCSNRNRFLNEKSKHKIIRSIFYGEKLSKFDSSLVYKKIYDIWQETNSRFGHVNVIKAYLYDEFRLITKKYLVQGDKVTVLDDFIDDLNQRWYLINYKGKKDINMWVKAEDIEF